MNGKELSRQLSDLPEEMIAEAMAPAKRLRRKYTATRVLRMAACLAVAVGLLLGIPQLLSGTPDALVAPLSVTVYAADLSTAKTLSPDFVLPVDYQWSLGSSWLPGCPITLSVPDSAISSKNITLQLTVCNGGFYVGTGDKVLCKEYEDHILYISPVYQPMTKQFTVPNDTTIFWNPTIGAAEGDTFFKDGVVAYADIIIFDEEKMLGYAVLKFERMSSEQANFSVSMVASESLLDDKDAITEEYVHSLIQKAKGQ